MPSVRELKIAVVAVDFSDQPFVITQPKQSDPFGNPQIDGIPRASVPQFYADFYGKQSASTAATPSASTGWSRRTAASA